MSGVLTYPGSTCHRGPFVTDSSQTGGRVEQATSGSPSSAPATGDPTWSATSGASERLGPARRLRPRPRPGRGRSPGPQRRGHRQPRARCSHDDDVDAVAIATPGPHAPRPSRSPRCGPASTCWSRSRSPTASTRARAMVAAAEAQGLVLMVDHTYCYTPVGAEDPRAGRGRRARRHPLRRLGAHQPRAGPARRRRPLGPRPARPVDPRLRPARRPAHRWRRRARRRPDRRRQGLRRLPDARRCRTAAIAHVHVNWLSPTKIRQMVIGGSQRTLVWDDLNPPQRLSVYDRGVDLASTSAGGTGPSRRHDLLPPRRHWSPALPEREALGAMVGEFAASDPRGPRPRDRRRVPACGCSTCSSRLAQHGRRRRSCAGPSRPRPAAR